MFYAEDTNGNTIEATRGATATCPSCRETLTGKAGAIITTPYWSHHSNTDCDTWARADPKTDWHKNWQKLATQARKEVSIPPHRADIVATDGQIIELQNSHLNADEIREREQFYKNMVWIWNTTEPYEKENLLL